MEIQDGYSICFNEWALDKDIKNELGLLLIISSLCAEKGYCFASNEYFANTFKVDKTTISKKIKKLEDKNYISIEYEKRGCEVISRHIRLTKMPTDDWRKNQPTIGENAKDKNISINNTSINNKEIYKESISLIVDYLNNKTNQNYRASTSKTQSLIIARLKEGYRLEDFQRVIDTKCAEWLKDDRMSKYLRPETLFGNKFENYLNQPKQDSKDRVSNIFKEIYEREVNK